MGARWRRLLRLPRSPQLVVHQPNGSSCPPHHQLPAEHQLDLPLWMVQPLQERHIVDTQLPAAYSERCVGGEGGEGGEGCLFRKASLDGFCPAAAAAGRAFKQALKLPAMGRPSATQVSAAGGRGRVVRQLEGHAFLLRRRPPMQRHVRGRVALGDGAGGRRRGAAGRQDGVQVQLRFRPKQPVRAVSCSTSSA